MSNPTIQEPHELTEEEIRNRFLHHIGGLLRYWENLPDQTLHERMEGLVFSILATLDGEGNLPAFLVAPYPCRGDKKFLKKHGANWFPYNGEADVKGDIAGGLHEYWSMNKEHYHE